MMRVIRTLIWEPFTSQEPSKAMLKVDSDSPNLVKPVQTVSYTPPPVMRQVLEV